MASIFGHFSSRLIRSCQVAMPPDVRHPTRSPQCITKIKITVPQRKKFPTTSWFKFQDASRRWHRCWPAAIYMQLWPRPDSANIRRGRACFSSILNEEIFHLSARRRVCRIERRVQLSVGIQLLQSVIYST